MIKRYSDTRSRGGSFAGVLLLATLTISLARSSSRVAPDIETATGSMRNVIIQCRHAPNTADHHKVRARGGALRHEWQAMHAAAYAVVWGDALTNTPESVSSVNVLVYGEQ
jgi:hypothetical protein